MDKERLSGTFNKQQARIDRFEDMKEASRQARAKFDKSLMDMSSVSRLSWKKDNRT